ncbi:hypothetical protein P8A18_21420 [Streptomyces castrisilvae]|uniref:Uncharacterized protein n=1 Tax=Streptomyces castrisilvae TaxID=3033811 RepID=A0ABY9HMR0_9ACTN|nr:hypothetical protein [Streptomyces sp. Mut1]WLQ35825.1 hypothetical protein P8A18_21420 [Streptomyces sp. Mut1]
MVSVGELSGAQPGKWRDAADDAIAAAKQCEGISSYARDEVASTLGQCWVGDTGRAARGRFVKHADDYEAASMALRAMARAYDGLADDITDAQRDLTGALDYARTHELKVSSFGRFFDWSLQQTVKPDKSLGITHMKLETARAVITNNRGAFMLSDGTYLADFNDSQLTKYIEENPDEDVRLSAYHLKELQGQPYGAETDKQLFTLYAADTPDVREKNEQYGDESGARGADIKVRGENWDRLEPHLDDAMAWDALSDEERAKAIRQLESDTPAGHHVSIEPIYAAGGPTTGNGSGDPEPGTPSPSPGPAPTPPGNN